MHKGELAKFNLYNVEELCEVKAKDLAKIDAKFDLF
jgi:hypothetical protein